MCYPECPSHTTEYDVGYCTYCVDWDPNCAECTVDGWGNVICSTCNNDSALMDSNYCIKCADGDYFNRAIPACDTCSIGNCARCVVD